MNGKTEPEDMILELTVGEAQQLVDQRYNGIYVRFRTWGR